MHVIVPFPLLSYFEIASNLKMLNHLKKSISEDLWADEPICGALNQFPLSVILLLKILSQRQEKKTMSKKY